MHAIIFLLATQIITAPGAAANTGDAPILRLAATIPLSDVSGRIDHLAVDPTGKHLFVAALGNNTVEIVDLDQGKRTGRIEGVREPQGVWVIPGSGTLVVASGEDGKCRAYDAGQRLIGTIGALDDADNVRYDPRAKMVYVGYGKGSLAVIESKRFARLADIQVQGHPESFQLEARGRRIFVNVPAAGHVAVINREKRSVTETWPITEARANFPMALDEANQRLFVGCRRPARLVVLDTRTGKLVSSVDCCGDTDDVFYDAAGKLVYVIGGEGYISVFRQMDADTYTLAEKVGTSPGARTGLFVPRLSRLFIAVPKRGEGQAEIRVFETPGRTKPPS